MFELDSFQINLQGTKALIVSDSDSGIAEMEGLFVTLGGHKLSPNRQFQAKSLALKANIKKIDPHTYLGKGKILEIANIIKANELDLLIMDFELSPSQMKAIEKEVQCLVIDRAGLILEIFNHHARTKEAKLQVEIARLEYLMPRLTRMWTHFERQSGAGGSAHKGKGMGEKQIEVDRRLVKDRISFLRKKLSDVEASRSVQRKARESILKVALVGYTNAGKSTLLNKLTSSNVLVEDALFATLDAQVKLLNPKTRPAVLAIDTVGFIDRLPHTLVASFKSTLSSVCEADLLIHVIDASSAEYKRHAQVTMEVLKELKAEQIPMMLVLNKMDLCENIIEVKAWANMFSKNLNTVLPALFISAENSKDVEFLKEKILSFFNSKMKTYDLVVPFEDGKIQSLLYEYGVIEQKKNLENGTFFRFKTLPEFAGKLNLEKYLIGGSSLI